MLKRALKDVKNAFMYKHLPIFANYNTDGWVN
jgi:hypothetical protein